MSKKQWIVSTDDDYSEIVVRNLEDGCIVANCSVDSHNYYYRKDIERHANLIAAAPALLEALKALYDHCAMVHKQWGEGCNQKQADAAISAGQAAIAKAEGREL